QGRQISLIVSSGVVIFPMPDVRFETLRNAQLELSRFKLQLAKTTYVSDDTVPRAHVVAQDPLPLSRARQGSKVALTLSRGGPNAIKVPNLTGMAIDDARAEAARDHVHLGQIVWTPFGNAGPPRGTIVRQSPAAGAAIDPYDDVSLQVSDGPGQFGYIIRQVHATATVPAS